MSSMPNQRCTCGATVFWETRANNAEAKTIWTRSLGENGDPGSPAVGGVQPENYNGGEWANVNYTEFSVGRTVRCRNCNRLRSSAVVDSLGAVAARFTPMGVYVRGVGNLASTWMVFSGMNQEYAQNPTAPGSELAYDSPDWVLGTIISSGAEIPGTPRTDTLMFYRYPDVMETGEYTVTLFGDSILIPIGVLTLEAIPVYSVNDAVITPGPHHAWCLQDSRVEAPAGQPGGESTASVPFDKCDAVIEFNYKNGLPSDQGWTLGGTASASAWSDLPEYVQYSNGAAQTSYWTKTLVLASGIPTAVHVQAAFQCVSNTGGGKAVEVIGMGAENSVNYFGARFTADDARLYTKTLDGSLEQPMGQADPAEWVHVSGASTVNAAEEAVWLRASSLFAGSTYFGTGSAAPATQITAQFGTPVANACSVLWRNVVVSTPGRFVRAQYRGVTTIAAPVLHLYMRRDEGVVSVPTARFKITYGALLSPGVSTAVSAVLTNANELVDVAVTLSSANPGPLWWTIERVWDSALDAVPQTVHLLHSALRAS